MEDLPLVRTAALVPEFAVEDLPLGRTAALLPEFGGKTCHWVGYSDDYNYDRIKLDSFLTLTILITEILHEFHAPL